MKKRICVSGLGLTGDNIAKALDALPTVYPLGYDHKREAKKQKKRMRELARRQKRLDLINNKEQ